MLSYVVILILGISVIDESFEPHAEYMVEGKTWKKSGFEYAFQRWVEDQTKKKALVLMPVSYNYAKHLVNTGISENRITVMPCCVDNEKFKFNEDARMRIRRELGVSSETVVGIYVGKFGDIYLNEEAFDLFRQTEQFFGNNFFLIILSPQDND